MNSIYQQFQDRQRTLEIEMGESLSISGLVGPLRIFQRQKGHRHSIDDATTAWYALQQCPESKSALDLGTGIGTVGLAVLWGLPLDTHLTCVEAQEISYRILVENIKGNNLEDRVNSIHADIRELNLDEKFPLITGSPPYFPAAAGIIPSDSQKAHARFELRGDVGDYAKVAKRHLREDGQFVFCFPYQQKSRCIKLVTETGLTITKVKDIIPRKSKPALFSVYAARLACDLPMLEESPLIVADENGKYSAEMLEIQKSRGFGPEGTNRIY